MEQAIENEGQAGGGVSAIRSAVPAIGGSAGGGRSATLDAIRGIAILQVVVWHYTPWVLEQHPSALVEHAVSMTWSGVDLFFVLSGYLIGGNLLDQRQSPRFFGPFYIRRFLRIAPLYAVLLASYAAVAQRDSVWPYLTFTQNFVWAYSGEWGPPWTGATWSLAVEEQFYLVLPLLVRRSSPRRLALIALALILVAFAARLALALTGVNPYPAYILLPCRMDTLFIGVLVACIERDAQLAAMFREARNALLALTGALAVLQIRFLIVRPDPFGVAMSTWGYTADALFYGGIVMLATQARPHAAFPAALRPLAWAGIGAYAIYLAHMPVLATVHALTPLASRPATLLALAITVTLAYASWHLIEHPLIRLGKRVTYRPVHGAPGGAATDPTAD